MKILWLVPTRNVPWITTLRNELAQNSNISLSILFFDSTLNAKEIRYTTKNVNYIKLKIPRVKYNILTFYLIKIKLLEKFLKNNYNKYDLIHIFGTEHQHFVATYKFPIPQVLMIQGFLDEYKKFLYENDKRKITWNISAYYERKFLKHIKNFTVCTDWDIYLVNKHSPGSKMFHIWNMIRPEFYNFDESLNLNSANILFIGGTEKRKGLRELLKSFNIAFTKNNKLKINIIGNFEQKVLEKIFIDEKINNKEKANIELYGFLNQNEIIDLMRKSFCIVHPTHIDNWPNVVSESQLVGLPVIASNVGGVGSLIKNMETGILTDLNPENIANNILLLHRDDRLRQKISNNARIAAKKRHNPDIILAKTLEMYKKLIDKI